MRFADFERTLYQLGWRLERMRGSHRNYRHASGHRLTLSVHGNTLERGEMDAILKRMQALPLDGTRMHDE